MSFTIILFPVILLNCKVVLICLILSLSMTACSFAAIPVESSLPPPLKVTVGVEVYPEPPSVTVILLIAPLET